MEVGLYGKLPSHGDFLRRRASDAFVSAWDSWLQDSVASSRAALGDRWLDVYLTSPAWRFAAGAGTCGPAPVIGLMAPSVDRVGRYFPLTLVAELPPHANVIGAVTGASDFFERGERLVIETLAAEYIDFEDFDQRVTRLADELAFLSTPQQVLLDRTAAEVLSGNPNAGSQLPIASTGEIAFAFEQLLSHALGAVYDPLMVWWTEGSSVVEPSCLIGRGLPPPDTFAALLEGSWLQHRWRPVPARIERIEGEELPVAEQPLSFRSVASSDVGLVREINQDAFLERPEIGLWVVADGLGGHADGHVASRMICDALADFDPGATFEDTIEAVRDRIHQVNDHLLHGSARALLSGRSGSTVVVLLVRHADAVVLWAGDSRVYRLRAGRLQQLTRDHSVANETILPVGPREAHMVTRAVGVTPRLDLELCRERVRAGDRFLLCSDGLTRVLSEEQISEWMQNEDIAWAVDGMIRATLDGGAPDNVTVLIAEAQAERV